MKPEGSFRSLTPFKEVEGVEYVMIEATEFHPVTGEPQISWGIYGYKHGQMIYESKSSDESIIQAEWDSLNGSERETKYQLTAMIILFGLLIVAMVLIVLVFLSKM